MANILLIEDNRGDIVIFQEILKMSNLKVSVSAITNGNDAVKFLFPDDGRDQKIPDLILLDLNIPSVNGFEILEKIRDDEHYNNVPVLVYTSSNNESDISRCYELKANAVLAKPESFSESHSLINSIINFWLRNRT